MVKWTMREGRRKVTFVRSKGGRGRYKRGKVGKTVGRERRVVGKEVYV